jgi:hypothetical protein
MAVKKQFNRSPCNLSQESSMDLPGDILLAAKATPTNWPMIRTRSSGQPSAEPPARDRVEFEINIDFHLPIRGWAGDTALRFHK